ncbi:hypothetical protein HYDPIDRAFT_33511 [Hydnomerulius pinastri MD-312]|uniref:Uncharacterized protein n=1 Tax=Hydnomerulius pinastri MD-312 TaxID=994086 RepID=A0A0C9VN74_9AGAM|nr:hypothetical protein HYDPIDRAFT_33511 [Hydnomerulius pinastri MD-312]
MSSSIQFAMPGALSDELIDEPDTSSLTLSTSHISRHLARKPENVQTVQDDTLFGDDEKMQTDQTDPTAEETGAEGQPGTSQASDAIQPEAGPSSGRDPSPPNFDISDSNAAGQPPDDEVILFRPSGTAKKRGVIEDNSGIPIFLEKRCYKEVDYSQLLRKGLYEKEEIINQLKSKLRQQGAQILKQERIAVQEQYAAMYNKARNTAQQEFERQNKVVSNMQAHLQQREVELSGLCSELKVQNQQRAKLQAQIQGDQELAAQTHKQELDDIQRQFEEQLGEFHQASSANLARALQQRDQEFQAKTADIEKRMEEQLDRAKAAMAAGRESELADFGEVRRLFKDKFGILQDADFITHVSAAADDVHAFEYEDGAGPDVNALSFDLTHSYTSLWNSHILELLLRELQQRSEEDKWPAKKPDNYIREILKNRYRRLRTTWLKAQPKLTVNGVLETPAEVEKRLLREMMRLGKESRQATRRRNKYHRRVAVLDHIAKLKTDTANDDLPAWEWLQHLIKTLSEHGMSSEESAVENEVEHVLRVKNMEWRRYVERELDLVDAERILDSDIFSPQGAKPVKRSRAPDNPTSRRDAVMGLPMDLYDGAWIASLTQRQLESLEASNDKFIWMKVAAV